MRTETELNEALARFSGWRKADLGWTSGDNYFYIEPPDFCHSLDACLKWLAPKFRPIELGYFQYDARNWQWRARLNQIYAFADTPAPAFARAVELAIDAESKEREINDRHNSL